MAPGPLRGIFPSALGTLDSKGGYSTCDLNSCALGWYSHLPVFTDTQTLASGDSGNSFKVGLLVRNTSLRFANTALPPSGLKVFTVSLTMKCLVGSWLSW